MSEGDMLSPALAAERRVGLRHGLLIVAALFLLIALPWLICNQELSRQEGLFAAITAEFSTSSWQPEQGLIVRAHHQPVSDAWPLYPAVVSLLCRAGMPVENALRTVSVVMLGLLSLLAGAAAGMRSGKTAGLVAGCCCFSTVFAMQKSVIGGPETMAAFFLFSAQLLFFHYGSRRADWNSAWIASAILVSLGFLAAGPLVVAFFVVPLIFLRRPLSFSGKFRTPGFAAGIILLGVVVLAWAFPFGTALRQYAVKSGFEIISFHKYMKNVLTFLPVFPVRMLPWSLVMWMPFCVALQAISPVPVFSRYLRTLFFPTLALVWLLPGTSSAQIFFLLGPLSVLTGLDYELGVRRYGRTLRRLLAVCWAFFPVAVFVIALIVLLPERFLGIFGDPRNMMFRDQPGYLMLAAGAAAVLGLLAVVYRYGFRWYPIWVPVAMLSFGIGVMRLADALPYHLMDNGWRRFGGDVRRVLPEGTPKIYKYEIDGMYCGLFYVGLPVHKLRQLEDLDGLDDTVYLISSRLPVYPDRVWTPLFPRDYTCRGTPVSVWRGVRPDERELPEESHE